jgi:hypothetical protein
MDPAYPAYRAWCEANRCDHGHCPEDCEHPQPFARDGKLYCGRCWFVYGETLTEMIPCGPVVCNDR